MSLAVASLHIHPIKSLGGFGVSEARITDRGFEHDRRWMLVDADGVFITQRGAPQMACLHCKPIDGGFRVEDLRDGSAMDMAWDIENGTARSARVWDDEVDVLHVPTEISAWFADRLEQTSSLVYMPDRSTRKLDARYATGINSLSDGFPYLILSNASLADLNSRLDQPLPMERFRPNIVIAGGSAYQEDDWKEIKIGEASFSLVKPCFRCAITTTDQRTGERGKEPLRTLATYRKQGNEVAFGMNAMALSGSLVRVGDLVAA